MCFDYLGYVSISHFAVGWSAALVLLSCVSQYLVSVPVPRGALGWSVVNDCGISWSYSFRP